MQHLIDLLKDPAVAAVIGGLAANIITPLVRRIPAANIVLIILRAVLSGVPTEAKKPAAEVKKEEQP